MRERVKIRRQTVEECLTISVVAMRQDGVFAADTGSRWALPFSTTFRLEYTVLEYPGCALGLFIDEPVKQWIRITTTKPNFGGLRYWFMCPVVHSGICCGRRVGRLYLPPGGSVFGCRTCLDLTYESVRRHDKRIDELLRNPFALRSALKQEACRQRLALRAVATAISRLRRKSLQLLG